MANKQVGVNIAFSADTSKAKASIQELQTLLNKITYSGVSSTGQTMTKDLQNASAAAKELQYHLNNAYNANTGKLDLSLLDKSLKTTGSNITNLSTQLLTAGTTGQQAFVKIAQSIAQAEQPVLRVNSKVKDLVKTLGNAAKYQLGNMVVQGMISSVSSAIGYAKDLNSSLNEIRIVSGKSADEMAKFAESANKAAKALSTTTTDYTGASLIYYQQGLTDEEVQARTETTIKMANVAGTSAQTVSDQMTAVWNNFYDGSKSLEYYSDVMVKLGAATASSTDEISEGVNKFAATAKTVGLSYEYATAALATVTATTRESADTVGNAYKTLFSRIQGLNLGETQDDGTTLNKYSQALANVGVNIKDTSGQLKDMDTILDELGEKWQTLAKDEQVALAETVGGARQYTQLMALLDNWDYFKENLDVAYNAEGALEEQAQIYEESWDAASDKVQAALEGVYQSILDDKFFISLNNGFANALGGLEAFIEGAGGVKTVIAGISSIVIGTFANKIPDALQTAKYNIDVLTKGSQKAYEEIAGKMRQASDDAFKGVQTSSKQTIKIDENSSMGMQIRYANELLIARNKLSQVSDDLTSAEKVQYETELALIEAYQNEAVALKQKNEQLSENITLSLKNELGNNIDNAAASDRRIEAYKSNDWDQQADALKNIKDSFGSLIQFEDTIDQNIFSSIMQSLEEAKVSTQGLTEDTQLYFQAITNGDKVSQQFRSIREELQNMGDRSGESFNLIQNQLIDFTELLPNSVRQVQNVRQALVSLKDAKDMKSLIASWNQLEKSLGKNSITLKEFMSLMSENTDSATLKNFIRQAQQLGQSSKEAQAQLEALQQVYNNFNPQSGIHLSTMMGNLASAATGAFSAINSVKSVITSLNDDSLGGWEKFSAVMFALPSVMMTGGQAISKGKKIFEDWTKATNYAEAAGVQLLENKRMNEIVDLAVNKAVEKGTFARQKAVLSLNAEQQATAKGIVSKYAAGEITKDNAVADLAAILAKQGYTDAEIESVATEYLSIAAKEGHEKVTWKLVAAQLGLNAAMLPYIIAIAAVVGIIWAAVEAYNADAKAAEEAAEAAQQAAEEYTSIKEAYDELKDTISSIDESQKALEEMTKGTDEWREAVIELNNEVMDLISMYPQLAAAVKPVDGVLTLDKESDAYKAFMEQQQEQLAFAARNKYGAQVYANEAKIQSQSTDTRRKIGYVSGEGDTATYQTISQSDLDKIVNAYNSGAGKSVFTADYLKDLGINNDALISSIINASDDIVNLATAVQQNTQANELFNEQIASQYLSDDEEYQESEYQDEINDAVAKDLEKADKSDWATKYKDENGFVLNDAQVQEKYAELMGWTATKNGWGTGTYVDADGNEHTITDETARYALNKEKWLQENAVQNMEAVSSFFDEYDESNGITKEMIQAAVSGDTSGLTEDELNIEGDVNTLLDSADIDTLKELFGENIVAALQNIVNQEYTPEEPPEFDLSSWKSQYTALQEVIDDVAKGDNIDSGAYAQLGEEYQQYFQEQLDGTYALTIAAEDFKKIVQEIEVGKLKNEIQDQQSQIADISSGVIGGTKTVEEGVSLWESAIATEDISDSRAESWAKSNIANNLSESFGISSDDYESDLEYIQALIEAWNNLTDSYNTNREAAALSAETVNELDSLLIEGTISAEDYSKAIHTVALREAEALDIDTDELEDYIKYLTTNNNNLKNNATEATRVALAHKKMNKGLSDLSDNWSDYNKLLKSGNVQDYAKGIQGLKTDLSNLLNIDTSNFSEEWLTDAENMRLMQQAINGNLSAIDELRVKAAQESIRLAVELNPEVTAEQLNLLNQQLTDFQSNYGDLEIGASIDTSSALDALWELYEAGQATADDIQNAFDAMGWDPDIEEETYTLTDNDVSRGYIQVPTSIDPLVIENIPIDSSLQTGATVSYPVFKSKKATYRGSAKSTASKPASTGSGGGSSSTPKHAEKKNDSDKERYHTLINQLEDLNAEYDAISEAKDRAFGKDKLKNLDTEIAKTDELISKQEEYLDAIAADLPVDKAIMDAYYQDVIGGPAIEYDERGNIANYDAIQDAMYAKWNAMADAYDEDSTEWEVFEKKYEQLEKYIEQYEETYDLLRDEEQEYQDLLNQRIDLQLEKVQYTVEVQLEVSEDSLAVIEYQLGRIDDDGFKSLESIGLLSAKADEVYKQIQINKEGLNEALKLSLSAAEISQVMAGNMDVLNGKNFTEDQIDAIREYRDSLLELNEEFDDIREEIEEKLMEAFDAWQEKLEKGIDTIDHYGSVLESYKNIIDIVGTETLGLDDEFMNKLSQGSVDNAIDKLEATKAAYKSTQSALEQAEAKLAEARAAGDTKSAEMWEETIETLTEESQEAQENMLSAWEDALDKVAEQFEQSVERIIDSFNKSVYKLGGLEGLADDFSKEQERADMMLDDYEKIYELSKLSRDINKTIDDTDNLAGKQKLKKLLGEINDLQEDGVEMSQYDLEYLQKEYDLRLAEIELEEAQKAKNTVRLQKDNEGNWSYVYTQNADAVDEAQQKYEDALYAMQDLSSNYIDEMSEKLIETSQEMAEALAELRVEDFASIDEYYARVDEVQKYYQEQMDWQEEELNKAIANNSTLYEKDWKSYSEATGYKISDAEDFVSSFKDSLLGSLMNSESATANFNDLIAGSVETMISSLLEAANTYYENLENAMNAADTSIEDFGEDVGESIDQIADKSAEGAAAVEDMADRMNAAVNGVMDTIQDWQTTYGLAMEDIIKDNLAVIESINDMVGALSLDDYDASVTWNFSKANASAFDTGGYTGNWGKEGKLAVLHEKELVLNADDTVNMLNALKLTTDLLDMLELQTKNAQLGIGNLVANTIKDTQTEVLEQNVHITAEFPSVTDHNEVEEALLNLNNVASQYANRK